MRTLFEGLEEAFRFLDGVPKEILFDQMRSVIVEDRRWEGGPLVENPEFVRFAHHWQFRARACRPYRARTKGKVERPIRYVRDNFVYGREFLNDEDLDAQLERWLREVANVRHHRTIQQRPLERFEREERGALGPLAQRDEGPDFGAIPGPDAGRDFVDRQRIPRPRFLSAPASYFGRRSSRFQARRGRLSAISTTFRLASIPNTNSTSCSSQRSRCFVCVKSVSPRSVTFLKPLRRHNSMAWSNRSLALSLDGRLPPRFTRKRGSCVFANDTTNGWKPHVPLYEMCIPSLHSPNVSNSVPSASIFASSKNSSG